MTHEELERMIWDHEHILKDNGNKGIVSKMEIIWEWFIQTRGKNAFMMLVKDVLLSGGIIAFFVAQVFGGK